MPRPLPRRSAWLILLTALAVCGCIPPQAPPPEDPAQADPTPREQQLAVLLDRIKLLEAQMLAAAQAAKATEPPFQDADPDTAPWLTVRAAPEPGTGANTSAHLSGAPTASDAPPVAPPPATEPTLSALIDALTRRSQANPRDLDLKRQLAILHLAAGNDDAAVAPLEGLPAAEQAVWQQIMWALVNFTDRAHGLTESERAGAALVALDEARRLLARQAPLEIRNLAFCTAIRSFGNYTKLEANEFKPNQMVLLYCELAGFASLPADDGRSYRTVVKQRLELLTPRGDSVWVREFGEVEDLCLGPRTDFYFYSKFPIPDRILPGEYLLKVTMTDILAAKTAEDILTIRIH